MCRVDLAVNVSSQMTTLDEYSAWMPPSAVMGWIVVCRMVTSFAWSSRIDCTRAPASPTMVRIGPLRGPICSVRVYQFGRRMIVPPVLRSAATATWKPSAEATDRTGASNGSTTVPALAGAASAPAVTSASATAQAPRILLQGLFTWSGSSYAYHPLGSWILCPAGDPRVVEYAHPHRPTRRTYAPALAARGASRRLQLRLGQRDRTGALGLLGRGRPPARPPRRSRAAPP